MSRLMLAGMLCCVGLPLHAATPADDCAGVVVERAQFARDIVEREPVGVPGTDADALWFFSEIRAGTGRTLLHRWYWRDELVAEVPLAIRGPRWRTWSSKVLGPHRGPDWRVELRLGDGCLLGAWSLADIDAGTRDTPPQPAADAGMAADDAGVATVRARLADGDVTGARLALAELDAVPEQTRIRLEREIALARIAAQIEADALYLAQARLEQFIARPEHDDLRAEAEALQARLRARKRRLDDDMARALLVWERVREETVLGLICAEDEVALQRALAVVPGAEHLLVNPPRREGNLVLADVLDRRTGTLHRITQHCRPWLDGG